MRKARTAALAGIFLAAATSLLSAPSDLPRYDHIVVVIEENHSRAEVMGSPYLSSLAARGILFTRSFAVAHPSQPTLLCSAGRRTASATMPTTTSRRRTWRLLLLRPD
jgi:hypothetical protein